MSDPTLLEQKMAGSSEETGDIFDSQRPKDADVEIPSPVLSSPPTTASTETVSGENSAGRPTALSRKQPEPGPPATCLAPLAECQKSNAVTRSERSIRPPAYLKDFVQN